MGRLHLGEALGLEEVEDLAEVWVVLDELDERENSHGVEDVGNPGGVLVALEESQGLAEGEFAHDVESRKVEHFAERRRLAVGLAQFLDEKVGILLEHGLLLFETAVREGWGEEAAHAPVLLIRGLNEIVCFCFEG